MGVDIVIPRDTKPDLCRLLGLTPFVHIETDTRALRIQRVIPGSVAILECCRDDGTRMSGEEMIQRFCTVEWMRYRPLDAALCAVCYKQVGVLDEIVLRTGMRAPRFYLDSTVISNLNGRERASVCLWQDCDKVCRFMIEPLGVIRTPGAFVLAAG